MHARRPVAFLVAAALVGVPASPASDGLFLPPQGVVAATGKTGTVSTEKGPSLGRDDGRTPTLSAVLVGGLVGAFLLLGLAILPATAVPRFARHVDRLDIVVAGALALLAVTVVYLVSVLWG